MLYSWAAIIDFLKFIPYKLICRTLAFRFGKRAAHNEVKHNLHNVSVNILAILVQYIFFVLYVKIVPIFEAYFDRYVLSKVGIVMLFCIYCHLYMCFCNSPSRRK